MKTITLWLLVSAGGTPVYNVALSPTQVVERFVEAGECERVLNLIKDVSSSARLRCIQAKVYQP